jgi:hypothetical protein
MLKSLSMRPISPQLILRDLPISARKPDDLLDGAPHTSERVRAGLKVWVNLRHRAFR